MRNMNPIVNETNVSQLLQLDSLFTEIHTMYGLPPNWIRPQGFVTLSKIILEQQVSLQSAATHFTKLNNYLPEFTPHEILKLSDEEMRICQISRQKATYLRFLSSSILDKTLDLEILPKLTDTEVRTMLKTIKGIGDWTVDIYMIFTLQAKDIFPIGDVAVVTTMKELTPLVSKEEMIKYSEKWRPNRSLATFYLWHYYLKKRNRMYNVS